MNKVISVFFIFLIIFMFLFGCTETKYVYVGDNNSNVTTTPPSGDTSGKNEEPQVPTQVQGDGVADSASKVTEFLQAGTTSGEFNKQTKHFYKIQFEGQQAWTLKVIPQEELDVRLIYLDESGKNITASSMCAYEGGKDNICLTSVSTNADVNGKGGSERLIGGGGIVTDPTEIYYRFIEIDSKGGKGKYTIEYEVGQGISDADKTIDAPSDADAALLLDYGSYLGHLGGSDTRDCYKFPMFKKDGCTILSVTPDPQLDILIRPFSRSSYSGKMREETFNFEFTNEGLKGVKEQYKFCSGDVSVYSGFWTKVVFEEQYVWCVATTDLTAKGNYTLKLDYLTE